MTLKGIDKLLVSRHKMFQKNRNIVKNFCILGDDYALF